MGGISPEYEPAAVAFPAVEVLTPDTMMSANLIVKDGQLGVNIATSAASSPLIFPLA